MFDACLECCPAGCADAGALDEAFRKKPPPDDDDADAPHFLNFFVDDPGLLWALADDLELGGCAPSLPPDDLLLLKDDDVLLNVLGEVLPGGFAEKACCKGGNGRGGSCVVSRAGSEGFVPWLVAGRRSCVGCDVCWSCACCRAFRMGSNVLVGFPRRVRRGSVGSANPGGPGAGGK